MTPKRLKSIGATGRRGHVATQRTHRCRNVVESTPPIVLLAVNEVTASGERFRHANVGASCRGSLGVGDEVDETVALGFGKRLFDHAPVFRSRRSPPRA